MPFSSVIISGHSAGGHLAATLLFSKSLSDEAKVRITGEEKLGHCVTGKGQNECKG